MKPNSKDSVMNLRREKTKLTIWEADLEKLENKTKTNSTDSLGKRVKCESNSNKTISKTTNVSKNSLHFMKIN